MPDLSFFDNWQAAKLGKVITLLTGATPPRTKRKALEKIEQFLNDPIQLRSLVERLPENGRRALEILCELERLVPEVLVDHILECALGSEGASATAFLTKAGIIWHADHTYGGGRDLGLLPPIGAALRPLFDAWWQQRQPKPKPSDDGDSSSPPQLEGISFVQTVMLAHIASAQPEVTTEGRLFKKESKKLTQLFVGQDADGVAAIVRQLGDLDLLEITESRRMTVATQNVQRLLRKPIDQQAWLRWGQALTRLHQGASRGLDLLIRRPGWVEQQSLMTTLRAAHVQGGPSRYAFQSATSAEIERYANIDRRQLLDLGLMEQSHDGEVVRLAPAIGMLLKSRMAEPQDDADDPPENNRLAKLSAVCHLQPNFELIVPPEANASTVFEVGRVSRLVRVDAVATFSITEASIQQATKLGLDAPAILQTLEAACPHGVSPNVAQGITDFATAVRRVHLFDGFVAVAQGAELQGRLTAAGLLPSGVDGVFVGDPEDQARILKKLEKSGVIPTLHKQKARRQREEEEYWERERADDLRVARANCTQALLFRINTIEREAIRVKNVEAPRAAPKERPLPARRKAQPNSQQGPITDLAEILDVSPEEAGLFCAVLSHTDEQWREHFKSPVARLVAAANNRTPEQVAAKLLAKPPLASYLLTAAYTGFECCGPSTVLLGEQSVETAIEMGADLLVWPQGADSPITLTPHRTRKRGKETVVTGYVEALDEDRAFGLDSNWVGLGPAADGYADDDALGAELVKRTRTVISGIKTGRNAPCPCGSGKKYKKCCLQNDLRA